MLDRDLAELFEVKPIHLNKQVRRNLDTFPKRFMSQLSENEADIIVMQDETSSKQYLGVILSKG